MLTKYLPKPLAIATILAFSLLFIQHSNAASDNRQNSALTVDGAWIAEAPPNAHVMVGYMTINNATSNDIEIIKAESDLYSSIEFHETVHEGSMARMLRHDSLAIPAHGSTQLKRGGKHLMLFNPKKRLTAGDTVAITLTTKNKTTMTINITVEKSQF
jgi:copper(I)-binding protein